MICASRHGFESLPHPSRVISDWIQRRPHQALGMKTPAEAYALAARPVQEVLGHYMPTRPRRAGSTASIERFVAFGGVSKIAVPDNPRALVAKADRYEPELTAVYRVSLATTASR